MGLTHRALYGHGATTLACAPCLHEGLRGVHKVPARIQVQVASGACRDTPFRPFAREHVRPLPPAAASRIAEVACGTVDLEAEEVKLHLGGA